MRGAAYVVLLLLMLLLIESCNSKKSSMRIKTAGKDRTENLKKAAKDSVPEEKKPDTLSREVQMIKNEQFQFLANLIINNMVRAQQAAYDGRYSEAEKLLVQTMGWYPTSDALMLLGSVYEIQGKTRQADSVWQEARRLDPRLDERTSDLPRQPASSKPKEENKND
ncbi:MAG: hypothetical protein ACK417_07855 [Bacteroidia bacterium]